MRMKEMARAWLACAALAATLPAMAQTASAVRRQAEASMLVSGEIEITPQGTVKTYSIDKEEALAPEIKQLLAQAVPQWTFSPVERDGHAVAARSKMSLRLLARKLADEQYEMSIRGASFDGDPQPGEVVTGKQMTPPSYPKTAAQYGVAGNVYLLVHVGRDGKVVDVAAEQTNMLVADREQNMQRWRDMLEKAAIGVAKRWTFTPPTVGSAADDDGWFVRVPVTYAIPGRTKEEVYGQWQVYIPGPRQPIPWASPAVAQDAGVDVGNAGAVSQVGTGLRLKTPLDAG